MMYNSSWNGLIGKYFEICTILQKNYSAGILAGISVCSVYDWQNRFIMTETAA